MPVKWRVKALWAICTWGFTGSLEAASLSVDLSSRSWVASATAVVNTALSRVHPPLSVYGYETLPPTGPFSQDLDVGDGRHGVFGPATYPLFDDDADDTDSVIVINTDNYPDGLQVTSFDLAATRTLRPIGTNPLIIKSLSTLRVAGTIDCSGGDGAAGDASVNIAAVAGGTGRCGGAAGGAGGWIDGATPVAAVKGTDISGAVTGGIQGANPTASGGAGGGGGGAHTLLGNPSQAGEDPNNGAPSDGGAAGLSSTADGEFVLKEGGAGGGGGAFRDGVARGAGGGAGGGVIVLIAQGDITLESGSRVLANGGSGGDAVSSAGAGGGGGGGSILILSGGAFVDNNPVGPASISALGGAGGASGGSADGGAGADGRIWFSDADGAPTSPGTEDPVQYLGTLGEVLMREAGGGFEVVSNSLNLQSTRPRLTAVTATALNTSSSNSIAVFVATSSTAAFTPSWEPAAAVMGRQVERFVRVRVVLQNTDRTQPPAVLTGLSVSYEPSRTDDFDFASGGCGRVTPAGRGPLPLSALGPLAVFAIGLIGLRLILRRRRALI